MPEHQLAIRARNIGKKYTIGGPKEHYLTFRDTVINAVKIPFQRLIRSDLPQSQNELWALKNVTFDVEKGEVVGIIGRNGAGKSTLLKILSRITLPTEGTVELNGRVGSLLEVGTGFHPELTGRENIFLSGSILGMKQREIDAKLDEIVKFSEIEKFLDTPVKRYSSGMYVRLAFAVAAHLDTEILLVDEVLAVGDAAFQKKCLGKMGDVATKEGRTVLFVSHNMGAVEQLCKHSILLNNGQITQKGDTKDVIHKYVFSIKNEFEKPIKLRKDRKGTGTIFIDNIQVDNSQIKNRSLTIELSICNNCNKEFSNILLSITITDYLGRALSNLVNYILDKPLFVGVNGSRIRIIINNINLVPGTYYINTFISSDMYNSEIFDWIQHAAEFYIPDYDYYHKGHIPYIKGEIIYLDYDYDIL